MQNDTSLAYGPDQLFKIKSNLSSSPNCPRTLSVLMLILHRAPRRQKPSGRPSNKKKSVRNTHQME